VTCWSQTVPSPCTVTVQMSAPEIAVPTDIEITRGPQMHATRNSACSKQDKILAYSLVSFCIYVETKAVKDKWILQISTANLRQNLSQTCVGLHKEAVP
jgi:hypothetical protein